MRAMCLLCGGQGPVRDTNNIKDQPYENESQRLTPSASCYIPATMFFPKLSAFIAITLLAAIAIATPISGTNAEGYQVGGAEKVNGMYPPSIWEPI
ncbi:hypothetical protein B0H11DRAFT_2213710 [Mycena galericulata]|nr:hypothetical protein B0H11DRAFT_2213710 [Mycena galericulata]